MFTFSYHWNTVFGMVFFFVFILLFHLFIAILCFSFSHSLYALFKYVCVQFEISRWGLVRLFAFTFELYENDLFMNHEQWEWFATKLNFCILSECWTYPTMTIIICSWFFRLEYWTQLPYVIDIKND